MGLPEEAPPNPDRLLRAGDVIEVGNLRFSVIHSPGHSPGGISIFGHGIVFTGDTLLNGNIGPVNMEGSNHDDLLDSVSYLLSNLDCDTVVMPGHGRPTTIEAELQPFQLPDLRVKAAN